jgi:hypothetical protein
MKNVSQNFHPSFSVVISILHHRITNDCNKNFTHFSDLPRNKTLEFYTKCHYRHFKVTDAPGHRAMVIMEEWSAIHTSLNDMWPGGSTLLEEGQH